MLNCSQKIKWYDLASLPGWRKSKNKQGDPQQETLKANKFYMVAPFLQPLKRWINEQKKRDLVIPEASHEQYATDDGLVQDSGDFQSAHLAAQHVAPQMPKPISTPGGDLLALLRGQQKAVPTPIHTPPAAMQNTDAADRLKHLLSVGQSLQSTAPSQDRNTGATDLLAMLRQGSTAMLEPQAQHPGPPRTPVDQIAHTAYPPKRPSHNRRPSSHTTPTQPPPDFAYSPARIAHQQAQRADTVYGVPQQPIFSPSQPNQFGWNAQQQPQHAARPFERTGDPQFARDVMPVPQASSVPSANQLPAPKLSNHAMNLLNAFKSNTAPSVLSPPTQTFMPVQRATVPPLIATSSNTRDQFNSNPASAYNTLPGIDSRARQALIQQTSGDVFSAPTLQSSTRATEPATLPAKRPDAHKNSLLSLFRTPSAMAPEAVSSPMPVPLQAADSNDPGLQSKPQHEARKTQILARQEPVAELNTNHTLRIHEQTLESADSLPTRTTVNAPGTPDTGTVRRRPRRKADMTDSPVVSDSSTSVPSGSIRKAPNSTKSSRDAVARPVMQNPTPIKILKRPATTSQPELPVETTQRRPITPAASNTTRDQAKSTTPKQFQPQILRRPQGSTPSTAFELPAVTTPEVVSKNAVADVTENSKALLSLFKQPQPVQQEAEATSPTIKSPVSDGSMPFVGNPGLLSLLKQNTLITPTSTTAAPDVLEGATGTAPDEAEPMSLAVTSKTALLSLFGANKDQQQIPSDVVSVALSLQKAPTTAADHQNSLLGLFKKPTIPASALPSTDKPMSPVVARPDTFDRRPSNRIDHQASLLSLFGQQRRPSSSVEAGSSAIVSPTSVTQMALPPRKTTPAGGTIGEFKRASVASAASGQGQDNAMRSRMNSTTSRDGIASGSQTPISSTDRGFLLNYLKGL